MCLVTSVTSLSENKLNNVYYYRITIIIVYRRVLNTCGVTDRRDVLSTSNL